MQEQSRYGLQDPHLRELTRKLEQLEIRVKEAARPVPTARPPPPLPINPFRRDTAGGGGQGQTAAIGPPPSSAQMGGGALGGAGGNGNPAYRWRGVTRDAIIEGQFNELGPVVFPVTVTPQGNEWEA